MKTNEGEEFEKLHAKGGERFDYNWFRMNQWISDVARADGMDLLKYRLTLSKIAFTVLVNMQVDK